MRKRIGRRDNWLCQWQWRDELGKPRICLAPAREVDHIRPGNDHRDENLRCLCTYHHAKKSSNEGNAAQAVKRRQINKRFVRVEDHPGLL